MDIFNVLSNILNLLFYSFIASIIFIIIIGVAIKISKRFDDFWFYSLFTYIIKPRFGKSFDRLKADLFENIRSIKSSDESLRKENAIRILEIGTGEGANLQFYPKCKFISVDCNKSFKNILKENKKQFPNVTIERIIAAKGENINEYIPEASVDVVVITHVLCSVDDQEAVLKAAYKVLKKGGILYILEHVKYKDEFYYKIQQIVDPIWAIYFGGCRITRNPRAIIDKLGFNSTNLKYFVVNDVFFFVRPQLYGTAVK